MSETIDEIDILHQKVELLAEYLGVKFIREWDNVTEVVERKKP